MRPKEQSNKKKQYLEEKLSENIAKPKQLWQTVKSLGLPNKKNSLSNIYFKKKMVYHSTHCQQRKLLKNIAPHYRKKLVLKLPKPPNNFGIQSVSNYYKKGNLQERLLFAKIESDKLFKILKKTDESKAPGINDLSGIFPKGGGSLLATPITRSCSICQFLPVDFLTPAKQQN